MKLTLPPGFTGFTNDQGKWVCTGSQMGRRSVIPHDATTTPFKLRLTRLPFMDDCYDRWGAYWGCPANVWLAWLGNEARDVAVYVRADSREEAKVKVRQDIPLAQFYRVIIPLLTQQMALDNAGPA